MRNRKTESLQGIRISAVTGLPIALTLLLSACALGPDFKQPAAPHVDGYTEQHAQTLQKNQADSGQLRTISNQPKIEFGGSVPEQWWLLYQSPALNALIEQGLKENPSLSAARSTLLAAQEDYASQGGPILYPSVDATLSADRQKLSGLSFGQNGGFMYSLQNASVDVSFAFDPFGSGRRYLESLRANIDYQGFQVEAAYLTLTANIVTAAISEASLRGQLQAMQEIVESQQSQLDIIEKQFELGVVTKVDVLAQRATLAQTRTGLPPLQKQLAQVRHYLSVLAGRLPGQPGMPSFQLSDLHLPKNIPVSLPSELVRQRPDIRAAEAQLHQASALVGLATANMYPSLSISAGFGRQAVQFGDLLTGPASAVWNIGGNILQPLFHGGELTAKRRQALASFAAARSQYRQSVLTAFQNVADVLRALQSDTEGLGLNQKAESLSEQRLKLVQRQFELGAASYLSLLSAQQQFRTAHISVVQARATLIADTAALFQAMGGGWWQRGNAYKAVAGGADFGRAWTGVKQTEDSSESE